MKVWIVNPFDNLPTEGFRPQRYWLMASAFADAGHEVTLWTQDWSHAFKARRSSEVLAGGGSFALKAVSVPGYTKNISFGRLWSHWRFACNWRAAAEKHVDAYGVPDVIVSSSPPLGACRQARLFCAKHGSGLVVDIMDAWPETFERVAPRFTLAWMRAIAGRNYRCASAITAVAKRYIDLASSYGSKAPTMLCHHGIKFSPEIRGGAMRRLQCVEKLVYAGNMSLSYDLATVIDAVKSSPRLELDIAGSGPDEPALRRRSGRCERIRFHGYLMRRDLAALLREADAGIVPMLEESCVGVPYKLADYAAAGLPVLSSLDGETGELLRQHRAGTTYDARDVQSFITAVTRLETDIGAGKITADGISSLAAAFDADRLYPGYVRFVESVVLRGGSRT